MNIVDPILFQCRVNAEQPAICAPGTEYDLITYAQLEFIINNLTRAVLPLGFEPGQIIGIRARDPVFHVGLIIALTRIGAVTLSFRAGSLPPEIGVAVAITDSSEAVVGVKRVIRANPDWVKGSTNRVADPRLFRATGDEICRIVLTSGSTGEPKGIALTHRMLIARNIQFAYAFGGHWQEHSRLYCDLGMSSEPAFRFLLYMLMRGGMIMFYGSDPLATLQSLDLFKIQNMVTSPRGLGEHLKSYEQTGMRCCLDHILALGGSVSSELLQAVWSRMCPHVFSDYGATEVGSVASADLREVNEVPGRTGYVVPPARVEIVSEDGTPVAANTEGIVRLQTPFMAAGYVGLPEASRAFRDGWFYPGDFGYVSQDKLLVVTGRLETRLNVSGDKIHPDRIEEVLRGFPGVKDAAVLTVPNALGIEDVHALIETDCVLDADALLAHCQAKLGRSYIPVRFITVGHIPRSEGGKIQRGRLLDLAKGRSGEASPEVRFE